MYRSHWGLAAEPFRSRLDPACFHASATHEEALARLHFLVEERRRLGLLLGGPGSGKSFVLEVFATQVRQRGRAVANVSLLGLTTADFLWSAAVGLGGNPRRATPVFALWRTLIDRIAEFRYQQLETVLLLDDADLAPPSVLTQVTRLAKHDMSADARLTVVLAGQADRMGRVGLGLLEMAELRIDLEPWEPAETAHYLTTALARSGQDHPIFDPQAIERLHELAQGVPRRVAQIAELALVAGAGRNLQTIDAETVESACQELCVLKIA